jgi:hypothetical protein
MSSAQSAIAPETSLPAPIAGSVRYFVSLYTPRARRRALASLLALADEIGAGLERGLDHALAHARLDWWRQEADRYRAGSTQHPLLRTLLTATPESARLELQPLILAAQIDLAEAERVAVPGARTRAALFVLAATTLGATSLTDQQREALGELGALTAQHERTASAVRPASPGHTALQGLVARLGPTLQPTVAPLLIWAVLSARESRRRTQTAKHSGSLFEGFAQNLHAWSIARHAAQGNLRIR